MDGQNFNNGENTHETQNTGYYQDNTANAQYQTPVYNAQPAEQSSGTNTMAIVSLVLGILSIVLSCCYGAGVIFGIVGVILAVLSKKQGKSGMGTAGMVCSIIGIVASVIMIILMVIGVAAIMDDPSLYYNYY